MARYEAEVMNAVALRGTVTVQELAELLGVSDQTIRRVVGPMAERGEVAKVHGAVMAVNRAGEPPFLTRMGQHRAAKVAIATTVASIIADGDSIALDGGSTTGYVAQALRQRRRLSVVTNSSFIATSLATITGNRVHMAGVELRNHDGAAFDAAAFATLSSMRVRYAILSASAVDPENGFMVQEHAERDMAEAMGRIAGIRIMALDSSKFGRTALVALPRLRPADIVVTDRPLPAGFESLHDTYDVRIAAT